MKKIGVILSGCGVYDGSEIHEAVLTLLAISRSGIININTLLVRFASAVDGVESPLIIHTGNEL